MARGLDLSPGGTLVVSRCRGQGDTATMVLNPRPEPVLALSGTWNPMTLVILAGASHPYKPRSIGASGSHVLSLDCLSLALLERGWGFGAWGWAVSASSQPPLGPAIQH